MNKSFMGKKLLSLLLSVLMCLSLIPSVALATTAEGETEGSTTAENYTVDKNGNVTIYTEDGLFWFAEQVNGGDTFSGKTVTLENDIALTKAWTPIGSYDRYGNSKSFRGTFNGNAHTISNMSIISYGEGVGFFGETFTAVIKNLTIEGNIEAYMNYVGGIVGHGYATIENCVFKGNISGRAMQVGGIAGSGGFTITNCSVYGNIHADTWAGGIVGNCQDGGAYTGCYVEGEISSDNTEWGGGAAGITPMPLYPTQVISGCYSNTVVKVAGEEVNCPIIAAYNNPLDFNGYIGDIKIYDNSWNKQKNSNDSYPLYAEKNGEGGVLMEGKDVARDNNLVMIEDDLNYISGNLENVRIMNGSKITREQIEGRAVAEVNGAKYATLKEAVAAAKDGETVTLLANCSGDGIVVAANKYPTGITIDFAGYSYTVGGKLVGSTGTASNGFQLLAGNTITMKNGFIYGNASVAGDDKTEWSGAPAMMIQNYSNLTLDNMTVSGGKQTVYTISNNNGNTVIKDSIINAGNAEGTRYSPVAFDVCRFNSYPSVSVTVEGNSVINGNIEISGKIGEGQSRQLNIKDGTFNGKFSVSDAPANIAISGGTFTYEVNPDYCADGFIPTKNADGTYGVTAGEYVAKAGETKYESLAEAVAAAKDGDTVTLLADTKEDITIDKSITLDLGGKTLTNTGAGEATITITGNNVTVKNGNVIGGASYYNIEVKTGASATLEDVTATAGNNGSAMIDNWGTLTINSGTYTGGLDVVKNEPEATLNISGGTFTLQKAITTAFTAVIFNYGKLEISGGTFIQNDKTTKYGYAQVIHTDKDGDSVPSTVISGGTFKNLRKFPSALTVRESNAAAGSTKVSGGNFNKSILDDYCAEGYIPTQNSDGTYGVKKGAYVAEVNDDNYETLEEAYANADDGDTITLLANCSSDRINLEDKSITLVLNGYTVTSTAAYGVLFCAKNGNTITIDGTVAGSKVVGTIMITNNTYGHIVINGGTYENEQYCPIYVNGAVNSDASRLTITDATIASLGGKSDQDMGVAVYLAGYATSKFTNCTITAPVTGIEIRAGRLDLINCNVTGGTGDIKTSANGNGTTVTNVAVAVSQHNTKKAIELNITGGTYTGTAAVYQTNVQGTGSEDVKVNISSGTFNGLVKAETANVMAISGGTFSNEVPADYCAAGYAPKANSDGTYGVEPKATTEKRNLSVDINGAGKVEYSINGSDSGTWNNPITKVPYEIGTRFTVKAVPRDGSTFLYWVNSEGRVISDAPTYSFYLGDNLTIKAVFCYSEDNAYVTFRDMGNTILMATSADSDGYVTVPTNLIAYAGYTFMGWYDADGNKYEVVNGKIQVSGNAAITIYAKYKADTETVYTVTVDGVEKGKYTYGSYVTVSAEEKEGKEFAGWYINGTLVSYDKAYSFYVTGDVTLEASYSDTAVVKEPVITLLVSERKETGDGSQYIILTAAWSADSSYTFVDAGIIVATNNNKDLTLENVDEVTVLKKATRLTTVEGTYTHTLTLSSDAAKNNAIYVRAYFTFIKDGKVVTIYTTVQISKPI